MVHLYGRLVVLDILKICVLTLILTIAWVRRRPEAESEVFKRCFDAIYDDVHTYLQTKLLAKMKILEAIYIRQMLDILDGILMEEGMIVLYF